MNLCLSFSYSLERFIFVAFSLSVIAPTTGTLSAKTARSNGTQIGIVNPIIIIWAAPKSSEDWQVFDPLAAASVMTEFSRYQYGSRFLPSSNRWSYNWTRELRALNKIWFFSSHAPIVFSKCFLNMIFSYLPTFSSVWNVFKRPRGKFFHNFTRLEVFGQHRNGVVCQFSEMLLQLIFNWAQLRLNVTKAFRM